MKTIKQTKKELKAIGLTGREFEIELQQRITAQAQEILTDIINSPGVVTNYHTLAMATAPILEIFRIEHRRDFSQVDIAEDLQYHVFSFSQIYKDGFESWRKKMFGDESSETTGTETAEAKETWTERQLETLTDISKQLDLALTSDKTPDDVKECLESILYDMATEADFTLGDSFDAQEVFPQIIQKIPFEYGRGIAHCIHSILIHNTKAFQEFYDKRLDEKPLDLSSVSADSLKTNDCSKLSEASEETLAAAISAMLKNPKMPTNLYNVIGDALAQIPDVHTPENVLWNLKEMQKKEGEDNE